MPEEVIKYLFISFRTLTDEERREFCVDNTFDFVFTGRDFLFKKGIHLNNGDSSVFERESITMSNFSAKIFEFFEKGDVNGLKKLLEEAGASIQLHLKQKLVFANMPVKELHLKFMKDRLKNGDFVNKIGVVEEKDLKYHLIHGTLGI